MKMLFGAVVLATLVTSSAFAQSNTPEFGTGNVNPTMASARLSSNVSSAFAHQSLQTRLSPDASSARAQSSAYTPFDAPHISRNEVHADGRIIGQDPDPNVRLQLLRDYLSTR